MMTVDTAPRAYEIGFAALSVGLTVVSIVLLSAVQGSPLAGNLHGLIWAYIGYRLARDSDESLRRRAFVLAAISFVFSLAVLGVAIISAWPGATIALLATSTSWFGFGAWLYAKRSIRYSLSVREL